MNLAAAEKAWAERPKDVFISGGTKGIGLAIALRFSRPGARLFLNYAASDAAAQKAKAEVEALGGTVYLVKADVGTPEGAAAAIEQVAKATGHLDALIHSAAIPYSAELAVQDPKDVIAAVNLGGLGLLWLVQPAVKLLVRGSSVIFLSGKSVDVALKAHGALASAKALGECMVRYLAVELAPQGINVNTMRTGPLDTELFRGLQQKDAAGNTPPPSVTPTGRRLELADVAAVAEYLCSPAADMVRGQIIMVDGALGIAR